MVAVTSGADPTYVGSAACSGCHPTQFRSQSVSGHARTLFRAERHPLSKSFPTGTPLRREGFEFRYVPGKNGLQVKAGDGTSTIELPVEWAFGSGRHGVTFVSRLSDRSYLEHAFTYYSSTNSFGLTPGHEALPSNTLYSAIGQTLAASGPGFTIARCFQCHSTGPVTASKRNEIDVAEAGVRCEVCHGPGSAHTNAAARGRTLEAKRAIRNLASSSGEELNQLCGACHRASLGDAALNDWTNAWNVRHQPLYLEQSRCFRASAGGLSCITCHRPHEVLQRAVPAYYRQKCLDCHRQIGSSCGTPAESNCVTCHMPLASANSQLGFTNHWIGIYRERSKLIPLR